MGVTVFVSGIKRVINYADFEKFSHIIEHGLQGFTVKNITKFNPLDSFETAAQMHERLIRPGIHGKFCQKFKLVVD